MKKLLQLLLFAVVGIGLTACAARQDRLAQRQPGDLPAYEVYAIRYGVIPAFPVRALVAGADSTRTLDIALMVWLLRGPDGRNVLVDAGFFRDEHLTRWRVQEFVRPSEAIAKVGLRPEEITDIVITHLHWDHAGSIELFPQARVWIQEEEFRYYTSGEGRSGNTGVDPEDAALLLRLHDLGRVMLVDGDAREIIPGVRVYTGGRHTYASQYVGVHTADGTVVIASDNLYLYENLENRLPIAQTLDRESNLQAQARMRELATDPRLIVPGHDPEVFTRFPSPGSGVARIELDGLP